LFLFVVITGGQAMSIIDDANKIIDTIDTIDTIELTPQESEAIKNLIAYKKTIYESMERLQKELGNIQIAVSKLWDEIGHNHGIDVYNHVYQFTKDGKCIKRIGG
jgi:hypothetical protein